MSYYTGDYYQGDFWSKLGKGIKKVGKGIGRVAKTLAPIAAIALPAVGAATLVGRAYSTSQRIKRAGRALRGTVQQAQQLPLENMIPPTPTAIAAGMPTLTASSGVSAATHRIRRARRAAYKRRKSTTKKRTTRRRRKRSSSRRS